MSINALQTSLKSLEEDNSNPFMPYNKDKIKQEHIEMLNNRIVDTLEKGIVGINEMDSDEVIRNGKGEMGMNRGKITGMIL